MLARGERRMISAAKIISYRQFGLVVLIAAPLCFGADEGNAQTMHRGVKAKPIERSAPRYPSREIRKGQQGWVQLSYVVTTDGSVIEPVVQNSSGSDAFEKAALNVVKRWSYEPATWDGNPVQQCHTEIMISFAIEGEETGVTRRFVHRYKRAEKAITAGDLSKAQDIVDEIVDDFSLSLGETAWLWSLRARLAGLTGDKEAQLIALRRAIGNDGQWVDKKLYPSLLFVKTALEFENGEYSSALRSHDKLMETKFEHPQMELLDPYVSAVNGFVTSEKTLSIPALIGGQEGCVDCATNWHYRPLRRKFSIADVNGGLRNIEFRCAWQRVVDQAAEGTTWDIPEDWGDCSIIVFGEPGSTFNLLELPSA